MSFKRKVKKAFKRIIGDFTGVQWRDLDHKKVYAAAALLAAVLILVVVIIVMAVIGGNDTKPQKEDTIVETEEMEEDTEEVLEENPLEVDAYEEINSLVTKYFDGLSSGNTEMVEQTVDVLSDEEKVTIEKKKDYIEAYKDVVCYTKKGLEEDTYVVFASYEMKIYNIETPAPGIMALYVCMGDDGSYYIFNGEAPDELANYVLELAAEEDVAAVISDVDARYQQLITEDEDLGKFAQTMLESQEAAEESEEPEEPSEGDSKELENPVTTTVNDGIRIREGRSTETRMLATIVNGTEVKVYANYDDGWSKIEYSGTVGYCKTEFLTSIEGVPTLSTQTEETEEPEETTEETTQEEQNVSSETSSTAVNKKMKLTDAVRIRKERSTESAVLKTAYKNEIVKVLENYSDGWSKVDYNGTEGYCKTEFLAETN